MEDFDPPKGLAPIQTGGHCPPKMTSEWHTSFRQNKGKDQDENVEREDSKHRSNLRITFIPNEEMEQNTGNSSQTHVRRKLF